VEHERDESKRSGNLAKHGVDFAAVVEFDWAAVQESEDRRKNHGERRWVAFGRIGAGSARWATH
jgi:uncharacterized protein